MGALATSIEDARSTTAAHRNMSCAVDKWLQGAVMGGSVSVTPVQVRLTPTVTMKLAVTVAIASALLLSTVLAGP